MTPIDRETMKNDNWWPRKRREKENNVHEEINEFWINDLVVDKRIYREQPRAWSSGPQMGMDKIRATTDMGKYYVDFASSSTLHGFNHTTAPHRHPIERILAALFITGALTSITLLSLTLWDQYQNDTTLFVLDNDYRNFSVTRPALTVCPIIKYDKDKFHEVFHRHGIEDTPEARQFFTFIANATYREFESTPLYNGVQPEKWLTILWELKRNVVVLNEAKLYQDTQYWIVTERGFCLTIFSYGGIYTSYDYWMSNNWTIVIPDEFPVYNYHDRANAQALKVETDSFTFSAQHPMEVPEYEKTGTVVELKHIYQIEIVGTEVQASGAVEELSIHQRKCKKPEEGGLKMWPIYTQYMCSLECKYEFMREKCGCYPHFARPMPEIPICNADQLRCLGEHFHEFANRNFAVKRCGCLVNCDTTFYEENELTDAALREGSPPEAALIYHVEYPTEIIRRELQFGFYDFLTSIGGAAGLFIGASVISFIEIIYYVTLRLYWYRNDIRKKKKNKYPSKKKNSSK